MKKLLIMASLFWPQKKSGGPPISIMNLVLSIKDKFDIYIISKNHELNENEPLPGVNPGWNQFDFGRVCYVPKGEHDFKNIMSLIEMVQPDIIYQNSFFSHDDLIPVLFYKKRNKGVKVIVAPRGELYPERIRVGGVKKKIYGNILRYSGLLKDVYFQGTGTVECEQEMNFLRIPENRILNIQNISIVSSGKKIEIEKKRNELRLVYIARIHPTKNTLQAIKWLEDLSGDILYDIYGSIENTEYWRQCQEAIKKLPKNITVRYLGVLEHDKVSATIAQYHAYYMPTTGENFGHSIVEAMLTGKLVVISDQTPWTDVNDNGGYAIELNNEKAFVAALNELVCLDEKEYTKRCLQIENYIRKKLNVNEIVDQYIDAFNGE